MRGNPRLDLEIELFKPFGHIGGGLHLVETGLGDAMKIPAISKLKATADIMNKRSNVLLCENILSFSAQEENDSCANQTHYNAEQGTN